MKKQFTIEDIEEAFNAGVNFKERKYFELIDGSIQNPCFKKYAQKLENRKNCSHIDKKSLFIDYQERCEEFICLNCDKIIWEPYD